MFDGRMFTETLEAVVKITVVFVIISVASSLFFGIRGCNAYDRGYEEGVRDAISGKAQIHTQIDTTTVVVPK